MEGFRETECQLMPLRKGVVEKKVNKDKIPKMLNTTHSRVHSSKGIKYDFHYSQDGNMMEQFRATGEGAVSGASLTQTPSLSRHTIRQHLHHFINSQTLGA